MLKAGPAEALGRVSWGGVWDHFGKRGTAGLVSAEPGLGGFLH